VNGKGGNKRLSRLSSMYIVVLSCKSSLQSYPRRSAASMVFLFANTPQPNPTSRCADDISGTTFKALFWAIQQWTLFRIDSYYMPSAFSPQDRENPRPVKR
jgi:hypothetical protein